ncbi:hypothetical protein [Bradyrhizobium sp. sGM-13]|uniref:hypothetical protein n=1 Tax=Bradyrhizobium sp. sGM-13 TaxID=2831781 RepID=UPI001BD173C7|nr:hypothetical protein [Bradyrhizobium sp. sGM-13]
MPRLLALCLVLIVTPATAWTVTTEKDRLTDKTLTWARVTDQGATLLMGCLNGEPQPRLTWPGRVGFGQQSVGISYRFDDGPVVPRFATFGGDGASIYPWVADHADAWKKLKNGKRLRVQIGPHLFDFDLRQGGQDLPTVRC